MKNNLRNRIKNVQGFTLTEMIVVLAIIGILIALIAPNVARLIGSAQETSDDVVADQFLTAAQAYTTDAIRANYNITTAAATAEAVFVDNGNVENLGAAFSNGTASYDDVDTFIGEDGDASMSTSALAGDEGVVIYLSPQGAVMGTVFYRGTNVISVAGTVPNGKLTAPAAGDPVPFESAALRDAEATIAPATGVITP